jgi:hypothetical protein
MKLTNLYPRCGAFTLVDNIIMHVENANIAIFYRNEYLLKNPALLNYDKFDDISEDKKKKKGRKEKKEKKASASEEEKPADEPKGAGRGKCLA